MRLFKIPQVLLFSPVWIICFLRKPLLSSAYYVAGALINCIWINPCNRPLYSVWIFFLFKIHLLLFSNPHCTDEKTKFSKIKSLAREWQSENVGLDLSVRSFSLPFHHSIPPLPVCPSNCTFKTNCNSRIPMAFLLVCLFFFFNWSIFHNTVKCSNTRFTIRYQPGQHGENPFDKCIYLWTHIPINIRNYFQKVSWCPFTRHHLSLKYSK